MVLQFDVQLLKDPWQIFEKNFVRKNIFLFFATGP